MNRILPIAVLAAAALAVAHVATAPREDAGDDVVPTTAAESRPGTSVFDSLERRGTRGLSAAPDRPMFGAPEVKAPQRPRTAKAVVPAAAPQFPYRVGGRVVVAGAPWKVVLLDRGDQAYMIRAGEVLGGFRIDSLGGDAITVTHLATGQSSRLRYADALPELDRALVAEDSSAGGAPERPTPGALLAQQIERAARADEKASQGGRISVAPSTSPVAGSAAPSSKTGMTMKAPSSSSSMVMTPPAAGGGMVMTPPAAGGGMTMTPQTAGSRGPQ